MPDQNTILFNLRPEVEIFRRQADSEDDCNWVIYDPFQKRYFNIDDKTRAVLTVWQSGQTFQSISELVRNTWGYEVTEGSVSQLQDFLRQSNLTHEFDTERLQDIRRSRKSNSNGTMSAVMRKLFYCQIPVFRPRNFLETTYPYVKWLHSAPMLVLIGLMGAIGIYLASNNLSELQNAFVSTLSLGNSVYLIFALIFVKLMHEFGHAYAAVRYGCKIPTMGVALMVMFPVLYTDVTDAWKLPRNQRMIVSGAGIFVELLMAATATLLWNFLDSGPVRDTVFMIAAASWLTSLAVNLNPMMKFDGYYLLSDYLRIENLQSRAFQFGKWQIRKLIFAANLPEPEQVLRETRRILIAYAFATWVYRLFIFTAIVLLVYHFMFKLAGLVFLVIGIWFLILSPVLKEITSWQETESEYISQKQISYSAACGLALIALAFIPLSNKVSIPAILQASDLMRIYPPSTAILIETEVQLGQFVTAGKPIFRMIDPTLEANIKTAEAQSAEVRTKLARAVANFEDRNEMMVLRRQLETLSTRVEGLLDRRKELIIAAPITGHVVQLADDLHQNRWVRKDMMLAVMSSSMSWTARGYAKQPDIERLREGATGNFIPDDLSRSSFPVRLSDIPSTAATHIDIPELADRYGGKIQVTEDAEGKLGPVSTLYSVSLDPMSFDGDLNQSIRGMVLLNASRQSLAGNAWRSVKRVLLRESTF
ncbi:MAG: hypothetical protein AAF478_09270 [Pseudomonadota bacterium]